MVKEIKYGGYTATPSDYECPDGELAAAINLVPEENGMLKTILETDSSIIEGEEYNAFIEDGYLPVYIHSNSAPLFKHLILVCKKEGEENGNIVFFDLYGEDNSAQSVPVPNTQNIEIKEIISMGNVLVFLTTDATHFTFWDESKGQYKYLGDRFPELPLSFGLQTNHISRYIGTRGDADLDYGFYINNQIDGATHWLPEQLITNVNDFNNPRSYDLYNDANKRYYTEKIDGSVKKMYEEDCYKKNKFGHPFFVRYALKLKGKDEWINRSSPVLMVPWTIPECRIDIARVNTAEYVDGLIIAGMGVSVHAFAGKLDYAVCPGYSRAIEELKHWSDIIEAVDIFVSPPMYFYESNKNFEKVVSLLNNNITGKNGFEEHYHVPRLSISKWLATETESEPWQTNNGRIAAWDEEYAHETDNEYYDNLKNPRLHDITYYQHPTNREGICWYTNGCFVYPAKTEKEIEDMITDEHRFYRIASIKLEDLKEERTLIDIEDGVVAALEGQTQLDETGALHDHERYVYDDGFVYNQRLVFSGINEISLVTEISANALIPYTNHYNPNEDIENLRVFTAIQEGNKRTYKHNNGGSPTTTGFISRDGITLPYLFLPEPRLTHIALSYASVYNPASDNYGEFEAKKHKHLNGVYVYLGWDNFITKLNKTGTENLTKVLGGVHSQTIGNQLLLSDVNNPFLFSAQNIVDIDAEKIIAVESAVKAMSPSQYGQFPLYLFTNNGTMALEVASDGTFVAPKVVTYDVCINKDSITKLEDSVLFCTDRGIMLLRGSDSICISDTLNGELLNPSELVGLSGVAGNLLGKTGEFVQFLEFIKNARMLFDYTHQHIIVYNPERSYSYVYSLKSKQWGMMQSDIQFSLNSYPQSVAFTKDNRLVDMSKEVSINAENTDNFTSLLITRTLKLEEPDVMKTISTVIQRGKFRKGHVQSILYGSRDLFSWVPVWSSKDHVMTRFRGTPYKYFRIALLCNLEQDENIFGCTIEYERRFVNKLR